METGPCVWGRSSNRWLACLLLLLRDVCVCSARVVSLGEEIDNFGFMIALLFSWARCLAWRWGCLLAAFTGVFR